jgi:large subunit ribosomal protein L9
LVRVILTQDVPNLGHVGDVKDVSPGYARNYLLPRKLAIEATPGNLKQWEQRKRALQRQAEQARASAATLAEKLSQTTVRVPVRVGEMGRLFGSVTAQDIANALAEQAAIEIDRHAIALEEPLRTLGTHEVAVRLGAGVTGKLTVEVVPGGEA